MSYFVRVRRCGAYLVSLEGPYASQRAARGRLYYAVEREPVDVRPETLSEIIVASDEGWRVVEDYRWSDLGLEGKRTNGWGYTHRIFSKEETGPSPVGKSGDGQ